MSALLLPFLPLALAFWPVWTWYFERWSDRSDEPLGILSLVTFLVVVWLRKSGAPGLSARGLWAAAGVTAFYCLLSPWAPRAVQALLAVFASGICLCSLPGGKKLSVGEWSLLILSLPVVSTLNFYGGYPLRLAVTVLACGLLKIGGFAVAAQGTELLWGNQVVEVDAPCSGVKMLWFSSYMAATLAGAYGLRAKPALVLMLFAVPAALFGNVMRVTSLFFLETGILGLPGESSAGALLHQGIGVTAFVMVAAVTVWLSYKLKSKMAFVEDSAGDPGQTPAATATFGGVRREPAWRILAVTCLVAALVPLVPLPARHVSAAIRFPGWPATFEGAPLVAVPIPLTTARFLSGFPGEIAMFDDGRRRIILRWVTHESRQVHTSSDCYRGLGYEVKWLPAVIGSGGERWNCFEAARGRERLTVRERIYDSTGQSWSDVSAWYWSAFLRRSQPPWWVATVVERIRQ